MPLYELNDNKPQIGKDTFIADTAIIIGNVRIGEGCFIAPGAVIRGDVGKIIIGNGSNVQENVVIHVLPDNVCTIGNKVHLSHSCVVHNAKIGDFAVIGMNAVISDFAEIGEWAIIGEGAVVKQNTKIPSGNIAVGVPAKIIGTIKEEQKQQWLKYKKIYIQLSKDYLYNLKKI